MTWSRSDQAPPLFDVRRDTKGEFFEITLGKRSDAQIEVLEVKPRERHLLALVRTAGEKSKFLCGHDERQWFVAAIPEKTSASNVRTAQIALQPARVRQAVARKQVRFQDTIRRKNKAFVRQGEWFFIPVPEFEPTDDLVLRNEPLIRANTRAVRFRGGKPHRMEFAYRTGGMKVYVRHSTVLSEEEYNRLSEKERKGHQMRVRDAEVYARGKITHPDHASIYLPGWHRVEMNTEFQANALRHVVFVD